MRKIKLYIAISLNGKVARPDGEVDWLDAIPNPDQLDYGYFAFYDTIDTTIQGYNTYQKVLDWGVEFPYKDKTNYVLTRQSDRKPNEHVTFLHENPIAFIRDLKSQEGKDIWLIGGGQVNTILWNENLIDEIWMYVMPIVIPDGIDLFAFLPNESQVQLMDSKSYPNGVVELKYRVG